MLRFLLRPVVLAVLVTLLIWLAVIIYWQETVRLVTAEDVGIYLVGLPLLVVAGGLLLRVGYRRYADGKRRGAGAPAAAPCVVAADERERGFSLALLAIGLASAAGQAAADCLKTLKAREVQPLPDRELRNRDGFPVHAARVGDLATDELIAALEAIDGAPLPEHVTRALALLDAALTPPLDALAAALPALDKRGQPVTPVPRLTVDVLLPAAWDTRCRATALRHLGDRLAGCGWPAGAMTVNAIAADEGVVGLKQLDAFCLNANRADGDDLYLLAACESAIDDDLVSALEASGQLFATARPQGRIPGEGAAAVLVRIPPKVTAWQTPLGLLGRVAIAVRDKSADAGGRISHETLLEASRNSLAVSEVPAADVSLVVSDIDQRATRGAECIGAIDSLLPELDTNRQFIAAGQALGQLGSAGALLALGLAAAAVQSEDKPALLMAAAHSVERAAAVVRPWLAPAQAAAAT